MKKKLQLDPEKLKGLRELTRFTLREVAEAVGTSSSCISEWETGTSKPRYPEKVIKKLAKFFDVPLGDLAVEG